MNPRTLIAVMVGLVLVAFGGFYFALGPRSSDAPLPRTTIQTATPAVAATPPVVPLPPVPSAPSMATTDSVEAEIALSENAELLALLKNNFNADYNEMLTAAVRRRNEGVSDQTFGQMLAAHFQEIMRGKLKYAAGATMPTIDRLATNEASLFHALGTEGAAFCLKMLGKDDAPAAGPPPESVRQLMQLGTLYRFQAIVEGTPNAQPVASLTAEETRAFETALAWEGVNFRDVSSGAFFKTDLEPGKPCLTLERLHLAISRLPEGARRKIYTGMFFLGRDR